ncbi:MAG: WD40/YVTN/BNR-like repeat-containing protein [Candidatus Geothermincolia bacterium]
MTKKDSRKARPGKRERAERRYGKSLRNGIIALASLCLGLALLVVFYFTPVNVFSRRFLLTALVWRVFVYLGVTFAIWTICWSADGLWRMRYSDPRKRTQATRGFILACITVALFVGASIYTGVFGKSLARGIMDRSFQGNAPGSFTSEHYSWKLIYRAGSLNEIHGITAVDDSHVWAAATDGILFCDGKTWRYQYKVPRGSDNFPDFLIRAIDAADANHVWALGDKGHVLSFDGRSWTSSHLDQLGAEKALSVSALDPGHVWVLGFNGVYFFDGRTWAKQLALEDVVLGSISAADANHVWAACRNNVYFFDGTSWTVQLHEESSAFWRVFAADSTHVWVTKGKGKISFFDGTSWQQQADLGKPIWDISGSDPSNVMAVSLSSERREDNRDWQSWRLHRYDGKRWGLEYASPPEQEEPLGPMHVMFSIAFAGSGHAWVGGYAIYSGRKKN